MLRDRSPRSSDRPLDDFDIRTRELVYEGIEAVQRATQRYTPSCGRRSGDCVAALVNFREVVAIRSAKLGDDHPSLEGPRASIERCEQGLRARTK